MPSMVLWSCAVVDILQLGFLPMFTEFRFGSYRFWLFASYFLPSDPRGGISPTIPSIPRLGLSQSSLGLVIPEGYLGEESDSDLVFLSK